MKSLNQMIKQLNGLIDTEDLTDWENNFVGDIVEKTQDGEICGTMSDRQVTTIERIWRRHFA